MNNSGFKKSIHGINYQLKLLAFFLKRAKDKGCTFRLDSETDTGCFDDVFFEFDTKDEKKTIRLLQAKHTTNINKKITEEELLRDGNCNFGLSKYFSSYREIMKNPQYTNDDTKIQDFIIFTNMDIDQQLQVNFDSIGYDDILHYNERECKLLKIKDGDLKKQIAQKLINNSNLCRLAKKLSEDKQINFKSEPLKQYQSVLAREVFEVLKENGFYYLKLSESFLNSELKELIEFKAVFFRYWRPGKEFDINEMKSWKTSALNFLNNEKPVISNVQDFVKEIAREIGRAKESEKIVYLTKDKKTIKDNIDKLSEHLLVFISDDEKDLYYLNENFFNDNFELKGNLSDFRSELKEELQNMKVAFTRGEYKFCIKNFPYQKSSLPTDFVTDEEIEEFFNKFVLAVNQPNEVELGNIIAKDISSNPIANEFIMSKFQIYMLDWLKQEKVKLLTEKDAKQFFQDSTSNLRMSYHTEDFLADIKKHGIKFNSDAIIELNTNFKHLVENSERRILNIITEQTVLSSIKFHQILQENINYSYIFLRLSTLLELGNEFSSQNNNLLVIAFQNLIQDDLLKLIHKLKSILSETSMLKIILIGSSAFLNNADLNNDKYEDIKLNLIDLTFESQKKILSEGIVSFQGQNVNLDKLLNSKFDNEIDGNILSNLIHKQEIKIGGQLSNLGEIDNYYITRKLKYCVNINPDIQKDTKNFFILDNNQCHNLDEPKNHQDILIISDNSDNDFKDLCTKYSQKNIHYLKKKEEKLIWKLSFGGDLSKLRNFIDKNIDQFIEPKSFTDIKEKVVVIVAEPGMGKSTLLTHLALQTKKLEPTLCILKINLIDNAERFQSWTKKKTLTESDINDFLYSCFLEKTNEKSIKAIEKNLFDCYDQQGKLIVVMDGFDEISPDYKTEVIKLLKALKTATIRGLWITTRPYTIQSDIENVLNTFSYSLKPILEQNQISFLKSYWAQNLTVPEIEDALIKEFLKWFSKITNDKNADFLTIPLQLRMIAEIFQNKFENLLSKNYEQMFGENLNLVILYKKFIDHKFYKILMQKLNKDEPHIKQMIEKERTEFLSNHKKLALLLLFGTDGLEMLNIEIGVSLSEINKGKEKTGIIDRVINGKPIFVHKSYAEYFAALWMADNWKENKVKKFLRKHIFKDENYMIRKFFDYLLAYHNKKENIDDDSVSDSKYEKIEEKCIPILKNKYNLHATILNNDVESIKKILESENSFEIIRCLDKGGRTALHLIASYNYTELWNLVKSEKIKFFIDRKDQIFGCTPLMYAEKCGSWKIADSLLQAGANNEEIFKEIDNINKIYEGPNNPDTHNNMTILHIAVAQGLLNLAKVLLEKGSNVNARDRFGASTLHYATYHCDQIMVELFIKHVEQTNDDQLWEFLNARNEFRCTALHLAAEKCKIEVVELLIKSVEKSKPDKLFEFINDKDGNEYTALHYSAINGQTKVVKLLLNLVETKFSERMLELLNVKQNNGCTALHLPAETGKIEVDQHLLQFVEMKIPKRMMELINAKQNQGSAALHIVAGIDKTEIVELVIKSVQKLKPHQLWEFINDKDKEGFTALHLSASQGKTEVTVYLLKVIEMKFPERMMECICVIQDNCCTALHFATKVGQTEVIERLIKLLATEFPDKLLESLNMKLFSGYNALHLAVAKGKTEIVGLLLKSVEKLKPDQLWEFINDKDENDYTALHWSACKGEPEVVKLLVNLIEMKFPERMLELLNVKQNNGCTALHLAAAKGKIEIVGLLLKSVEKLKPDQLWEFINYKDKEGFTALYLSASQGKTEVTVYLLKVIEMKFPERMMECICLIQDNCCTALHFATKAGQTEVIERLIKLVATEFPEKLLKFPTMKQISGYNALHLAVPKGKTEIVDLLIKSVENLKPDQLWEFINDKDENDYTALHWSACKGQTEVVKVLVNLIEMTFPERMLELLNVKQNNGCTALHLAAEKGKTKVIELLIKFVEKSKPDKLFEFIKEKNKTDYTALHFSAINGQTEVVKLLVNLIEMKFPERMLELLNVKQIYGHTALHIAAAKCKTEIVKLLLKSVENSKPDKLFEFVNETDLEERAALRIAFLFRNPQIIKILINYKANVVARDNHDTILHLAVSMDNEEILELILNEIKRTEPNMVPAINASDSVGDTPLMWAAECGRLKMAKMLLEYGANLDMQNNDGETALHLATNSCYYEIVKLLLTKNANSNINDKNGKTPIKLAVEIWNKDPKNENSNLIMKLLSQWKIFPI